MAPYSKRYVPESHYAPARTYELGLPALFRSLGWKRNKGDKSIKMPGSSSSDVPSGTHSGKEVEIDANIRNFAPVARIMKNALPENAKIAKEAKECMQECVSEFISFITSEGRVLS